MKYHLEMKLFGVSIDTIIGLTPIDEKPVEPVIPAPPIVPVPSGSSKWQVVRNFEEGVAGESSKGSDGFDYAKTHSFYDDSIFHSGSQCSRIGIDKGNEGWKQWGGVFRIPERVGLGDGFYFENAMLFPVGFDLKSSSSGWIKGQRIRMDEGGAHDLAFCPNGLTVENTQDWNGLPDKDWRCVGKDMPIGKWVVVKQYVFFHETEGIKRVWYDGELVFEKTGIRTIVSPTDFVIDLLLFTQWNSGSPKDQHAYVDDVIFGVEE